MADLNKLITPLFLSEKENYTGGDLSLQNLQDNQTIKLAAGEIIVYPSTSLHSVEKVTEGEITQDSNARVIRDGAIIFNGKIGTIFREKNQAKQVSAGLECGITLKDFVDFQKKDIIEVFNSTITERSI